MNLPMKLPMLLRRILSSGKSLVVMITVFILYFTFVSFVRYDNFYSFRFDLGNMDQTVWNVLHGNGFTLTDPVGMVAQSRLAVHADFMLVLLSPLYLFWSSPKMLLLVQGIFFGMGALPLYALAEKKLHSRPLALMFSLAYLLYPARERTMLYDFHAVALAGPLLMFAVWYLEERKWICFCIAALLAALCKEQIWLTTAFLGIYVFFHEKKRPLGFFVAGISLLVFYLLFWKVIPSVSPGRQHFAFVYLSEFGSEQNDILKNIVLQPLTVLSTVAHVDRLYYLFQLFAPLGFFAVFSPLPLLFVTPNFAINLLSNNPMMRLIDFQYNSVISPFIFLSSVQGFATVRAYILRKWGNRVYRWLIGWFVVCMAVSSFLWGELPIGRDTRFWTFISPPQNRDLMDREISAIDVEASVSATDNVGSHLSERKNLYNFPVGATDADYVVVRLGDPYAWPSNEAQQEAVSGLEKNPLYREVVSRDGFYVFRRASR